MGTAADHTAVAVDIGVDRMVVVDTAFVRMAVVADNSFVHRQVAVAAVDTEAGYTVAVVNSQVGYTAMGRSAVVDTVETIARSEYS